MQHIFIQRVRFYAYIAKVFYIFTFETYPLTKKKEHFQNNPFGLLITPGFDYRFLKKIDESIKRKKSLIQERKEQGERKREGTFLSACTLKNKIKWKDEMGIPVETYAYNKNT